MYITAQGPFSEMTYTVSSGTLNSSIYHTSDCNLYLPCIVLSYNWQFLFLHHSFVYSRMIVMNSTIAAYHDTS